MYHINYGKPKLKQGRLRGNLAVPAIIDIRAGDI